MNAGSWHFTESEKTQMKRERKETKSFQQWTDSTHRDLFTVECTGAMWIS